MEWRGQGWVAEFRLPEGGDATDNGAIDLKDANKRAVGRVLESPDTEQIFDAARRAFEPQNRGGQFVGWVKRDGKWVGAYRFTGEGKKLLDGAYYQALAYFQAVKRGEVAQRQSDQAQAQTQDVLNRNYQTTPTSPTSPRNQAQDAAGATGASASGASPSEPSARQTVAGAGRVLVAGGVGVAVGGAILWAVSKFK